MGGGGYPPNSVTYFLDQNQVFFWAKNTNFSPFWRQIFGEKSVKGGRVVPAKSVIPFLPEKKSVKGGGGYPPYGQNPQSSIWSLPLWLSDQKKDLMVWSYGCPCRWLSCWWLSPNLVPSASKKHIKYPISFVFIMGWPWLVEMRRFL